MEAGAPQQFTMKWNAGKNNTKGGDNNLFILLMHFKYTAYYQVRLNCWRSVH